MPKTPLDIWTLPSGRAMREDILKLPHNQFVALLKLMLGDYQQHNEPATEDAGNKLDRVYVELGNARVQTNA